MNLKNKKLIFSLLAVFFSAVIFPTALAQTASQNSRQIDISAYVLGVDDSELDNGEYPVRFAIYAKNRESADPYPSNSDAKIWEETQNVKIISGQLNAYLGSKTALPDSLNFSEGVFYLGIRIGEDSEMIPRKKIGAIPLAINSFSLQGAVPGKKQGNVPLLSKGGKLDVSLLPEVSDLGTVSKGVWEADPIESDFIDSVLSGKTYDGLTLTANADGFSIAGGTVSRELSILGGNVSIDQSLLTSDAPAFAGLSLTGQNALTINPFGTAAGETGEIRLRELSANGSNYAGLKAPDSLSANQIWSLPSADGSYHQVLVTDGAGNLSWLSAGAGLGAPTAAQYVVLSADSDLSGERTLAGTANQIIITDGGANNPVTLSLGSSAMLEGENISLLNNNAGYITDGNTGWDNSYGFITDGNTGWDNSYGYIIDGNTGWDNSYGYITSADDSVSGSELDGVFSSNGILRRTGANTYDTITDNSANWNTAFGWGDHSGVGYVTGTPWTGMGYITDGNTGWDNSYGYITDGNTGWDNSYGFIIDGNTGWDNSYGYITSADDSVSGSELDGVFSTAGLLRRTGANTYDTITDNSANWNTAFGWGDHASEGYLTSYVETDPVFSAWDKSTGISITESQISDLQTYLTAETDPIFGISASAGITGTNITNWNTAFGWGDHSGAGYVTGTPWTGMGYITDGNTGWDNSYGYITDGNTGWDNSYGFITDGNTGWDNSYGYITDLSSFTTDNLAPGSTNLYSQWTTDGLDIYYTAGNVGIGTANPNDTLDVNGSIITTGLQDASKNTKMFFTPDIYLDDTEYSSDQAAENAWVTNSDFSATGGTITEVSGDNVHVFNSSGTFTVTGVGDVEALVVAGGGGGGDGWGGAGGGGGGLVYSSSLAVTEQAYSVTVGDGGAAGSGGRGTSGSDSVFSTITAIGGGGGAGFSSLSGRDGGSGGGAEDAGRGGVVGQGTDGQGYDGGQGSSDGVTFTAGGGGGGAGEAGHDSNSNVYAGDGGDGAAYTIRDDSSITYAGGGGGGGDGTLAASGAGGAGGGGAGTRAGSATAGTANTGGGGGGAGNGSAAIGGSGIVIIRYAPSQGSLATYSEATIKTEGAYSLKAIAGQTSSLGKSLTKTFPSNIDLTGINTVNFDLRASRTGSNIKFGLHDTGGTTSEITPNITDADTFQAITWDLSGVSDANKDAIDTMIITIVNDDAANTFYLDNIHYVADVNEIAFSISNEKVMRISSSGNVGIGDATPEAFLQIKSGTASAAPLKFTAGTNLAAAEAGAVEYDGTSLYFSPANGVRKTLAYLDSALTGTFDGLNFNTGNQGGIPYYSATDTLASSLAGTTGRALISGGTGSPTWFAPTAGSVLFAGTNGILEQDNAGLFWNNSSNYLGVGTAAPTSLLDLEKQGTAKANLDLLEITNSRNAADMDGTLSSILFNQWYYNASTPAVADSGRLTFGTETDWTSTASTQDSYLAFQTALDGTISEKMRITSGGNVGIGISPDADSKLHIQKDQNGATQLQIENASTENLAYARLLLKTSDTQGYLDVYSSNIALVHYQNRVILTTDAGVSTGISLFAAKSDGDIRFYTGGSDADDERMRILSTGNVGIGDTTPEALLQIKAGTASANTAPLKFTAGTNLTTAEAGAFEYDGAELYFTPSGTTRETVAYLSDITASAHNAATINATANGLSVDGSQVLTLGLASTSTIGALSDTDWDTFNNKVSSQWTTTGSNIYYNSGSVGIGTLTPGSTLDVAGIIRATSGANYLEMYHNGTDAILSSSSGEIMIGAGGDFILDSGVNLGIGVDAPLGMLHIGSSSPFIVTSDGNVGIGDTTPEALLQIKAGTASANTAPLKFTAGTNLTTAEAGAFEYDGAELYFTPSGTTRETIAYTTDIPAGHNAATINATANGLSVDGSQVLTLGLASTSTTGALSDTDWDTFNNKVSSQWTTTGSDIYYDGGNVGIGDTGSDNLLEIMSAGAAHTQFTISNINAGDFNPQIGFELADGTNLFTMGVDDSDSDKFKIYSGSGIAGTSEFTIDSTGLVSIANLEMGAQVFADDSGAISWIDMGVTGSVADNTVESYTAQLDGNNLLTIYGLADGSGGVDNLGVGIGTTIPSSFLDIEKAGTVKTNNDLLEITHSGNAADMDTTSSSILFNQWYYDASTPAVADAGRITVGTETDWTSTASTQDAFMDFQTATDGTVSTKMRIYSSGHVGIGDISPDYLLELYDTVTTPDFALSDDDVAHGLTDLAMTDVFSHLTSLSTTTGGTQWTNVSDTDAQALLIRGVMGSVDPTDATSAIKIIGAKSNGTTGLADLGALETVFQLANNDDVAALTVLGNGNVGIGTTDLGSYKLNVAFADDIAGAGIKFGNSDGSMLFTNNTSSANSFAPQWKTNSNGSAQPGMLFWANGATADDSGSEPLVYIRGSINDGAVSTRPILGLYNYTTPLMTVSYSGNVGIGDSTPEASLQIKAGTASANTAPLKFTSGTNLTTAEAGAFEYDGSELYFTPSGTTRETVAYLSDIPAGHNAVTINGTANGLSVDVSQVLTLGLASTSTTGALSDTDWDTFNNKVSSQWTTDTGNIYFNTGSVGIGTSSPSSMLDIFGTSNTLRLSYDIDSYATLSSNASGELVMTGVSAGGSSVIIGSALAEDTALIYDGNAQDYYIGLDDTDDAFHIGLGQTVGTTPYLSILSGGNVGIGLAAPTAQFHLVGAAGEVSLEINSNETTVGNNVLAIRSDASGADDLIFRVQANGAVFADGAYTGTGADYAEYFETVDTDLESGEAVCLDPEKNNSVRRCVRTGDNNLMGIISSNPSIVGNGADGRENDPKYKIVAMLGQIKGKISAKDNPIQIGDSLTSADEPGYLRKADPGESTVGVALENFVGEKGSIQILISRKNKSLTVEKVEEAVALRIKEMNVEDQVNALVAGARTELDAAMETWKAGFDAKILELTSIIEAQMAELRADNGINLGIISRNTADINVLTEQMTSILGENPESLSSRVKNLEVLNQLSSRNLENGGIEITIIDPDARTIGEDLISAGESVKFVETKAVTINSKIYITPVGSTNNQVIYVGDIEEQSGFEVKVDRLETILTPNEIKFNWWIVEAKEN